MHCWTHRFERVASAVLLVAVAGSISFGRQDVPWSGIRGEAGVHLGRWLSSTGGGIETPPAYVRPLVATVQAFESNSLGRAEATVHADLVSKLEAARACGVVRLPTLHFPESIWICGGCIPLDGWDWADLNAGFWIEPNEFLGADPTEAISRAFLDCRVLMIESLDDGAGSTGLKAPATLPRDSPEPRVVHRSTTEDSTAIRDVYFVLMLSLHCAEERWTPPDWDMVSPADFTAYLGVRPTLRIIMTGETFLLAEIDTHLELAVLHTGGKRGLYRIDVAGLLGELTRGLLAQSAN